MKALESRARARQQEAVVELGQRALAHADIGDLMEDAVALVAGVLGIEYAKVLELLPGGEELLVIAGVGWEEGGRGPDEGRFHAQRPGGVHPPLG